MIGRGTISCFAAAAVALSSHSARAADEPIRLAPSSKWNLEYAADSCRLARQFGEGEQTGFVILERFEPGDHFRLSIVGEAFARARSNGEATLRFGPEGEQEVPFLEAEWGKSPALIFSPPLRIAPNTEQEEETRKKLEEADKLYLFDPAPIGPERERAVTFLSVDASGMPQIIFETGSLGKPFAALRKCMDELLTHWGIDVARHKSLTREAIPAESSENWLRSTDYPTRLLRKGAQGQVHFRLSVDSEGNVSACHIQRSTRPAGFDEAVCDALMRRARFKPALDAEGSPTASYFIGSVRFIIG